MTTPCLNVVLFQPEIPQNTGNIGRTCVAANAKLWIVRPTGFRLDDHHVRRSGLDYWEHLTWEDVPDFDQLRPFLPAQRTFLLTKSAHRRYTEVGYQPGDFLVFGRETSGLPAELLHANRNQCLSIPMSAQVRSLNLSNAVAIVVYEAIRQWHEPLDLPPWHDSGPWAAPRCAPSTPEIYRAAGLSCCLPRCAKPPRLQLSSGCVDWQMSIVDFKHVKAQARHVHSATVRAPAIP